LQQLFHAPINGFLVEPASFERKRDVFGDGKRIEERARLKYHRHAPANLSKLIFGEAGHVFARDDDPAFVGL
jgi:hypothetical protein